MEYKKTNDWTEASLMKILNEGDYYQRKKDYSQNGLMENAKSMIETVTWNLGGYVNTEIETKLISEWYKLERGNNVYNGNKETWNGNVALIYLSDYGYATTGRSNCLNIALYTWGTNEEADCKNND